LESWGSAARPGTILGKNFGIKRWDDRKNGQKIPLKFFIHKTLQIVIDYHEIHFRGQKQYQQQNLIYLIFD
jgi:hypothetical protein